MCVCVRSVCNHKYVSLDKAELESAAEALVHTVGMSKSQARKEARLHILEDRVEKRARVAARDSLPATSSTPSAASSTPATTSSAPSATSSRDLPAMSSAVSATALASAPDSTGCTASTRRFARLQRASAFVERYVVIGGEFCLLNETEAELAQAEGAVLASAEAEGAVLASAQAGGAVAESAAQAIAVAESAVALPLSLQESWALLRHGVGRPFVEGCISESAHDLDSTFRSVCVGRLDPLLS